MSGRESFDLAREWAIRYRETFGRPYPPNHMSNEEFVEDVQRRIRENDPLPPELNNPLLQF